MEKEKIREMIVSIPHRYAKNNLPAYHRWVDTGVSIPHRYAKNERWGRRLDVKQDMFQFLIGTLKTHNTNGIFGGTPPCFNSS